MAIDYLLLEEAVREEAIQVLDNIYYRGHLLRSAEPEEFQKLLRITQAEYRVKLDPEGKQYCIDMIRDGRELCIRGALIYGVPATAYFEASTLTGSVVSIYVAEPLALLYFAQTLCAHSEARDNMNSDCQTADIPIGDVAKAYGDITASVYQLFNNEYPHRYAQSVRDTCRCASVLEEGAYEIVTEAGEAGIRVYGALVDGVPTTAVLQARRGDTPWREIPDADQDILLLFAQAVFTA